MARVQRNLPDVYNEPHLFDPPSSTHDPLDEDAETPMLPVTVTVDKYNTTRIRGSNNTLRIIFLTLCLAGLQFTWTVEMAYGTPYLLSLGLSKSHMSLVWIAGPLSGLIMQPVVGVLSDGCKSKWGRRRPFLVGGSIVVVTSLLTIGWTRELAALFTNSTSGDLFKTISIVIAITAIYILDFSVNCVQASCRALLVDSLPTSLQEDGTAWAGRMVGLGNVAGYFMGYADLVKVFPFFGNTQLKVLCVFAAIVIILCDIITCYAVRENVLQSEGSTSKNSSAFKLFADIFRNISNLPKPIQDICNVQFFAWIGWFPFLFYSTTWVAEIYSGTMDPNDDSSQDKVGQATRAGSFAFLVYSLVSLGSSFLVPLLVSPSDSNYSENNSTFTLTFGKNTYRLTFLKYLHFSFLTLPRAWTASHFIFCVCMLSTAFVSDVTAAAIVIGLCGISWSISMWAPFSLLGEYISKQQAMGEHLDDGEGFVQHSHLMASRASLALGLVATVPEEEIEMLRVKETSHTDTIGESSHSNSHYDENEEEQGQHTDTATPATGVLLGIHNMYIVLPQFLVTFLSSILFRLLENNRTEFNETPSDTIGLILRIGAVMAGVAGFISLKIGK